MRIILFCLVLLLISSFISCQGQNKKANAQNHKVINDEFVYTVKITSGCPILLPIS